MLKILNVLSYVLAFVGLMVSLLVFYGWESGNDILGINEFLRAPDMMGSRLMGGIVVFVCLIPFFIVRGIHFIIRPYDHPYEKHSLKRDKKFTKIKV